MGSELAAHVTALRNVFASSKDKYAAHDRARAVLLEMTATPGTFTQVLNRHLARADPFGAKHYPVVALDIETNADFGLVANCWIPLPDGDTDMSTKAIHHHGDMLLTTVTAFGPGYEHWMFTTPELVDESGERFAMRLLERAPHPQGHAAFVDAQIGHVPFFPHSLTVTLALWSSRTPTTWRDRLKRVPALHKHSVVLRDVAAKVGLARTLDLKVIRYFDFFPKDDGFHGMKERLEFKRGPNEDYLHSLFHVIQGTGNDQLVPTLRRRLESNGGANRALVTKLIADLEQGRPIPGKLSPGHYGISYANFRSGAVQRALDVSTRPTAVVS